MLDDLFSLSQTLLRVRNRTCRRTAFDDALSGGRLRIIVGPRGVGKTTVMVQQLLADVGGDIFSRKILYVQADHFLVARSSLYDIADEFRKYGGEFICFDEIHKYPDWAMELKSMADTFPDLRIIASGSSALEIVRGSHDLSRRALVMRMQGLSFREYLGMVHGLEFERLALTDLVEGHERAAQRVVETLEQGGRKVLALFQDYLTRGYYPYFLEYPDTAQFQLTLTQQIQATMEVDLPAIHPTLGGASIRKMRKLLAVVSVMVPFIPDMKALKGMLEIGDERTLKGYLGLLEEAGILLTVSRSDKGLRAMEKPEKIYLNNPNLYHALAGTAAVDRGAVRETFFLNMLQQDHAVRVAAKGDFLIDGSLTFEIGGKGKDAAQIKGVENAWLALDNIEIGVGRRIPLWMFGLL